jgi:hypothetical protein
MTSAQTTALAITVPLLVAVIGTCERLVTHWDLDCRASRIWSEHEDLPERLVN